MIPVDSNGNYTVAVSEPFNRPANATLDNGYVWLSPGVGEGRYQGARPYFGVLYIRFMGPDVNWTQSPTNISPPTVANPVSPYQTVMGPYYPTCSYMSKADFEAKQ
jgi:hypothetical protein